MSAFYLLPGEPTRPGTCRKKALCGQKPPLKPREVWAIRTRLQIQGKRRDLALFNLAIGSQLRSCDVVALRVSDILTGNTVKDRTVIVQQKTGRPVQFELTEQTREAVHAWLEQRPLDAGSYVFSSRVHSRGHLSTRQYAWVVSHWVASIDFDPPKYGTHSLRRTKAALIL